MSGWGPPFGFALRRNGSCLPEENGTGETWGGFHRCCPGSAFATSRVCCPSEANCIDPIMHPPHCADETWDLFQNTQDDGFFCCVPGTTGFHYDNRVGVGCIDPNASAISEFKLLSTYSPGAAATSTSSSTSNTGAIAGGVVGGVAGLAIIIALLWYFMRRRSQKQPQVETPIMEAPVIQSDPVQSSGKPSELDGQGYVAELDNTPVHELLGNPRTR